MRAGSTASGHVLPVRVYAAVLAALLVLTGVTVGVSLLELGKLAIYVALAVAVIKAALVIGYFMHLRFDVRFNSFVFLSALLFLLIFFSLTMLDLGTRGDVLEAEGNFTLRDERAAASRAARARQRAAEPKSRKPAVEEKKDTAPPKGR